MNLVFLINIILVKQMVREAGFKDWGFLAKPLWDTSQTRERRSALPASTILIHIRPKKDTRIFWIKQRLTVRIKCRWFAFCYTPNNRSLYWSCRHFLQTQLSYWISSFLRPVSWKHQQEGDSLHSNSELHLWHFFIIFWLLDTSN